MIQNILKAAKVLKGVALHTPLQHNKTLSDQYEASIWLKREDLQVVRSYKLRGAYNKINQLTPEERSHGVVCASAGNHAQGVAYSCNLLKIKGVIFMPVTTPNQKINQVKSFGGEWSEVMLVGDTFDDASAAAIIYCKEHAANFVHPFDDLAVIEGQGTVGKEIFEDMQKPIDYLFLPIGGGGLSAGVSSYFKHLSPQTKIIGVEPLGAPSMKASIEAGKVITLNEIDKFIDGAAVKRVGDITFEICKNNLDDIVLIPEGKACSTILDLYNFQAIVVEPAGALSVSALDFYKEEIKGKNVVCVLSGSNNDITRTQEIRERSLLYEGLKHFFIIKFPQRAGALKYFVNTILGETDDIVHFEYVKKHSRENGPAVVGLELKNRDDLASLMSRLEASGFYYEYINNNATLLQLLV